MSGNDEAAGGLAGLFHVIAPLVPREDCASSFAWADRGLICSLIKELKDGRLQFTIKSFEF